MITTPNLLISYYIGVYNKRTLYIERQVNSQFQCASPPFFFCGQTPLPIKRTKEPILVSVSPLHSFLAPHPKRNHLSSNREREYHTILLNSSSHHVRVEHLPSIPPLGSPPPPPPPSPLPSFCFGSVLYHPSPLYTHSFFFFKFSLLPNTWYFYFFFFSYLLNLSKIHWYLIVDILLLMDSIPYHHFVLFVVSLILVGNVHFLLFHYVNVPIPFLF